MKLLERATILASAVLTLVLGKEVLAQDATAQTPVDTTATQTNLVAQDSLGQLPANPQDVDNLLKAAMARRVHLAQEAEKHQDHSELAISALGGKTKYIGDKVAVYSATAGGLTATAGNAVKEFKDGNIVGGLLSVAGAGGTVSVGARANDAVNDGKTKQRVGQDNAADAAGTAYAKVAVNEGAIALTSDRAKKNKPVTSAELETMKILLNGVEGGQGVLGTENMAGVDAAIANATMTEAGAKAALEVFELGQKEIDRQKKDAARNKIRDTIEKEIKGRIRIRNPFKKSGAATDMDKGVGEEIRPQYSKAEEAIIDAAVKIAGLPGVRNIHPVPGEGVIVETDNNYLVVKTGKLTAGQLSPNAAALGAERAV